jgi:hypothetical protein
MKFSDLFESTLSQSKEDWEQQEQKYKEDTKFVINEFNKESSKKKSIVKLIEDKTENINFTLTIDTKDPYINMKLFNTGRNLNIYSNEVYTTIDIIANKINRDVKWDSINFIGHLSM